MGIDCRTRLGLYGISGMALIACSQAAYAQAWPTKPIRMICAYAPGGSIDLTGRPVAAALTEMFGQQVVYENRAGANGNLGAAAVAKAAPDGYTILIASVSQLTINPSLYADMQFNVLKDFAPITLIANTPTALVLHPSVQANSLKELLAIARAKPGSIRYSSAGSGSINHLAGELLKNIAKVDLTHVPYKGNAPATAAVMAGEVEIMITSVPPALPMIKSGRVKVLTVAAPTRYRSLPDVPTMAEAGAPGVEGSAGIGLVAPTGTPRPIISRLHTSTVKIINTPEIRDKLLAQGVELFGNTPEEFAAQIKEQTARWEMVIRSANITMD